MARRAARTLRVVLAVLCTGGVVRGGAQTPASDTVYAVHGTVVNGTTGKPLAMAEVISGDRRVARLTDSEGRFSFDLRVPAGAGAGPATNTIVDRFDDGEEMPAGELMLRAVKPGYLQGNGPVSVAIGPALSSTELKLKLMPTATVSGRVTASGAEFASGVQLILYRRNVNEAGRYEWVQAGMSVTNSRGEYRFAGQMPGEVTVMAAGWRGDPEERQPRRAVHDEYPKAFYGDAKKFEGATKVHLHYGDRIQADLHLQAATYYPVTVPVLGQRANEANPEGLNVELMDTLQQDTDSLIYNARDRAVEGSLPSGDYTMLIIGAGEKVEMAVVPLHVEGAAVRTKPVALAPMADIAVRVRTEFTRPDPAAAAASDSGDASGGREARPAVRREMHPLVNLQFQTEGIGGTYGAPEDGGSEREFFLHSLYPGRFHVLTNAQRGYVAALTSGGVDLLQEPLVVSAGAAVAPIEVVLRDDSSTVSGTVAAGALGSVESVFLLPMDSSGQFERVIAGPDGRFSMVDVVPGSYRAIAVEGGMEMIPYRDAAAMRRYDGKGVTIKVTPGQAVEVDVPLLQDAGEEEREE